MAVFQDLEEDPEPPEILPAQWQHLLARGLRTAHIGTLNDQDDERVNPNKNVMTEALGCYPYVQQLCFKVVIHELSRSQDYQVDSLAY